jgi:uncharacterized protein YbaR (Trm112 family)
MTYGGTRSRRGEKSWKPYLKLECPGCGRNFSIDDEVEDEGEICCPYCHEDVPVPENEDE